MANVVVEEQSLIDIANAIRNKNETSNTYKPSEMASAILDITTSEDLSSEFDNYETYLINQETTIEDIVSALEGKVGGVDTTEIEDAFITHTLSGDYENDRVTKISYGTFYGNTNLTGISFPNVTEVGGYAFYKCTKLTTMNMPKMTKCGDYSFYGINVPNLELLELTTGGSYAFRDVSNCESINAPKLTSVSSGMFRDMDTLKKVDLGAAESLGSMCFYWNQKLETLIIRTTSKVCSLSNVNVLGSTKISGGTGYVYVPDELVEEYKAATNWSTFANQIKPLSELEGV